MDLRGNPKDKSPKTKSSKDLLKLASRSNSSPDFSKKGVSLLFDSFILLYVGGLQFMDLAILVPKNDNVAQQAKTLIPADIHPYHFLLFFPEPEEDIVPQPKSKKGAVALTNFIKHLCITFIYYFLLIHFTLNSVHLLICYHFLSCLKECDL
jgi:hypothetical protein